MNGRDAWREDNPDSCIKEGERGNFARRTFAPALAGEDHAETALTDIPRLDEAPIAQRSKNERSEPVVIVIAIGIGLDDCVGGNVRIKSAQRRGGRQAFPTKLFLEKCGIRGQVEGAPGELNGLDESIDIEKDIH